MFCKICGTELKDGDNFCNSCGEPVGSAVNKQRVEVRYVPVEEKKKKKKHPILSTVLIFFGIFLLAGAMFSEPTSTAPEMSVAEYKAVCREISYEDLARNPDSHKDEYFTFTGEVIQVVESSGSVSLRVNVTPVSIYDGMESYTDMYEDLYGETLASVSYYQDTIYATAKLKENGDRILEGDIIEIYGVCQGLYKYMSVLGAEIAIPRIDVGYWEIVK